MLNEDEVSEAPNLSPDQCASILDDVFGGVDIALFPSSSDNSGIERPSKKARTAK